MIAGLFDAGLDVTEAGLTRMPIWPLTRPPAARAGYDQGKALAGELTEFWR